MTDRMTRARLIGAGKALPVRAVSNADLAVERGIETSDEWIVERTGIHQRYVAGEGEYTSTLATAAAQDALKNAGVAANTIDLVIVATTSPDYTFPAVAVQVQAALGITHGFAFDVQAVCSGFVYALATANSFIRTGQAQRALVIGAETFTRLLDWTDRTTCILFGDGAGAVVVEASDDDSGGIRSTHLHADGRHRELLYTNGGPSRTGTVGTTVMEGRDVFKHAVQRLAEVVDEALAENDLQPDAIDWLIPHQANRRIIEGTAKKLNMPMDKVVVTVGEHGNTSAASIPLALATAVQDGRIKPGDLLLLEAMGGGFTWGSVLARWG